MGMYTYLSYIPFYVKMYEKRVGIGNGTPVLSLLKAAYTWPKLQS